MVFVGGPKANHDQWLHPKLATNPYVHVEEVDGQRVEHLYDRKLNQEVENGPRVYWYRVTP